MSRIPTVAPLAALLLAAACAAPVAMLQPIPADLVGAAMVAEVDVTLRPRVLLPLHELEQEARRKRAEAGLPPAGPEAPASAPRDQYATLPFTQMLELAVTDATRRAGLTSGRPLRITVRIDMLRLADPAMTVAAGSRDQLAGTVAVADAETGESLGAFRIDVVNAHAGFIGLALRGRGVREALAEEFALHIARQLSAKAR
jgi:hypothetical protein